jgi:hypothetical protein
MPEMAKHSDTAALWAILWRSVVFVPYMWLVFSIVGSLWLARWILPVWGALLLYDREWWSATGIMALWVILVAIYRRFRLTRFFEWPPSLL